MKPSLRTLLICSCLLAAQRPAEAQVDLLSMGVGIFDVIRGPRSLLYQVEYKSGWNFYNLRWMAGLMGTGQGRGQNR